MNALTKLDLDLMVAHGCQTPDCKHDNHGIIFLHGRCHPSARMNVCYTKSTGQIHVTCGACDKPVAVVKVAEQ